jgi:hypothetical protein
MPLGTPSQATTKPLPALALGVPTAEIAGTQPCELVLGVQ